MVVGLSSEEPIGFWMSHAGTVHPHGRVLSGSGAIPFPKPGDRVLGGHAIVAVGYDDAEKIGNDKGALLIGNSWGTAWGESGYGRLPYTYAEAGLADDFWSLVRSDCDNSALFV